MESGRLRIQFQRFGANFADRWPRWTGARLIEVHLHSKSFGGTLKWPLKGGSRLIEVTATAGLTVFKCHFFLNNCTYLTFDLTVTLNQKITLGIHPYIVCNSPRNNSSLDAEH